MKLTLIRHSNSKLDPNIPISLWSLSDKGIDRVVELAKNEDMKNIEILYSSLQTKAIETSLIIAKANNLPMNFDERLKELTSFTNKFEEDNIKYLRKFDDIYDGVVERLDNGETLREGLNRFNIAIEEIVNSNKEKNNIGIVSHGNVLALFSAQYLDRSAKEIQSLLEMPDYAVFDGETKTFIKNFSQI